MSTATTCVWRGASGQEYTFTVFALPVAFNGDVAGNYIFSRLSAAGWVPIYIGQGDLSQRANYHHQAHCIRSKGATHFHCHSSGIESMRLFEERDLLANYPQAYQPTGCNERTGG